MLIAVVELSGQIFPTGISSTNQFAGVLPISFPVSTDPDLANAVVVDSGSAAVAIGRFRTISSSTEAAAFWYFIPPTVTHDLGTHRAFGDAPVGSRPTSGIAQYNYVGGTLPIDNYGRPGAFFGSNLTMNFASQTVQSQGPTTITFSPNAAMNVFTHYVLPAQPFSMNAGVQTLTGVVCSTCIGTTVGTVNGQFLGANYQGFAASVLVTNTQLTTVGTANAGGNVSVYARQLALPQ